MSDTPRTDKETGYEDGSGCWKSVVPNGAFVYADFARTLERELTKAQAKIEYYEACTTSAVKKRIDDLVEAGEKL